MKVAAVAIAQPRTLSYEGREVTTGIFKTRTAARVEVRPLGLAGDGQADRVNHGGENKAVYAYPREHYSYWAEQLGRELEDAQFGENLTLEGLLEDVGIGDVLQIGSAKLQVTQPRKPCFKLGIRMNDPTFVKRFHHSGRTGFYLRVFEPGTVGEGDAVTRVERGKLGFSIRELWRLVYERRDGADEARRALEIPWLASEFRRPLLRRAKATR